MRNNLISIGTTFGFPDAVAHMTAAFSETEHPNVPDVDDSYVFRRETVRDLLAFLDEPCGDSMYLTGPHGSGKTSVISQMAARLNWPVQSFTAHARLEFDDMVGTWKLSKDGGMDFVYAGLANAMKYGHLFILNEVDRADPGNLASLHDVLEGRPLVVAQNGGEVIRPHENFRFFMTGNSVSGDNTGLYSGVNRLDVAFMDRCRTVRIDYPEPAVEVGILKKVAPDLPEETIQRMVTVAGLIRRAFVGDESQGESAGLLNVTLSTRTLCRWAYLSVKFRKAGNPLEYALEQALLNRAEHHERKAILQNCKDVFGEDWIPGGA